MGSKDDEYDYLFKGIPVRNRQNKHKIAPDRPLCNCSHPLTPATCSSPLLIDCCSIDGNPMKQEMSNFDSQKHISRKIDIG